MSTVLISGGTGLTGRALTKELSAKGYDIIILTRRKPANENSMSPNIWYANWDLVNGFIDHKAIAEADIIIHLAGAGVAEKRWTKKRKKEILESRTKSADLLVKSLKEIPNKVRLVIAASAIGYYKASLPAEGNYMRIESEPPDPGFLGRTCRKWEQHLQPFLDLGIRMVILRTGIVLSTEGGALPAFMNPIRFGIAAVLGSGNQVISWIHIEDLCRIYLAAILEENMDGTYNAVAPNPVTNIIFTKELAHRIRGEYFLTIHVPAFVLKLVLGEMSVEVLKSARVSAEKIRQTGFQFVFPSIQSAFENLFRNRTSNSGNTV